MYLKSIEIQGFKSFANKTVLQFNEGVTGIVGPNGSGKSNVADAVRWVLGEQKVKQLRGASMQDVIFAGTEIRKPQGFAFVAITLDNSDKKLPVSYKEVTVSRRLYRSGESEYMINGQQVRLRDVQELFYDTGIGREGYSIIGQGQIDAILNGKPEDRRGLFDEAAGIVKFKRRKQIAERKLEAEHANLLRITDILNELERQVGPLKKQAENAANYLKLRDTLKTYDLNLFIRETESILERLKKAEENFNIVSASLQDAKNENDALKESHERLSDELAASDAKLREKQEELQKGELLIQNLEGQIAVAKTQIASDSEHIKSDAARMESIGVDREEKEHTVLSYLHALIALGEQLALVAEQQRKEAKAAGLTETETKGALGSAKAASNENPFSIQLDGADKELLQLKQKIDSFTKLLRTVLGMDEETLQEELKKTEEKTEGSTSVFAESKSPKASPSEGTAEAQNPSNPDVKSGTDSAFSQKTTNKTDLSSRGTDAKGRETEHFTEPAWMREIRHKQDSLTAIKDREQRVKAWMDRSAEEYNAATEVLKDLNRSINDCQQEYHMTRTRLESLRNIAERYEGYGQSIRSVMQLKNRVRGIRGVVADLIKTEKRYETAVETALGGSIQNIVTDSEATAKTLIEHLKKNRLGRATFLPLDAIRGETQENYRKAAKETFAIGTVADVVQTEPAYQALAVHLLGRTLLVDTMEHALLTARKYNHSLRIVTLDGELLSPGGSISGGAYRNSSNLIGRVREIDELKEKTDAILRKVDVLNQRVVEQERAVDEKNAEIERFREELKEISIEKNTLSLGIMSEMKLQYAGLSQKTAFISENITRLASELAQSSETYEKLLSHKKDCMARVGAAEAEIAKREADIRAVQDALQKNRAEAETFTKRQQELAASQKEFFTRRESLSGQILGLEKELMRLGNQKEKEQQRLDSQTAYIWAEYELSLSGAKPYYDEKLGSPAELKNQVQSLKAKIRALGPVNVQAVEDYKEVSERYAFMHAQHADLVASEQSITAIIADLDAGMKRQFHEKFREIQAEFDRVFKELFGGGLGTLELVENEDKDVLEAGIAINAQPPGKKLQNMMQLSGGEKALTAIALLFAIQNLKPSPFCLLDEIEAALDDSNVSRFANYLHKLTKDTQFIVITHRRGTMEAADRLYGITMQEKGVTALVSVDLVSDQLS